MSSRGYVLDTCVLVPMPLADTLLRLASRAIFRPVWSEEILAELARTLVRIRYTETQAQRRVQAMNLAFPDALTITPDMRQGHYGLPDPDDEHVLGIAIHSGAQAIVTLNLKHFPQSLCNAYGIEVVHPDSFLSDLFRAVPDEVCESISEQARATRNPALSEDGLLELLRVAVPEFVNQVRPRLST